MNKSHPKSLAGRPQLKSELLGQVFTPNDIAERMAQLLLNEYTGNREVKVLDPCVGPYTFPREVVRKANKKDIQLTVIDIDREMISKTSKWSTLESVNCESFCEDYLELPMDTKFDYAIFNPPYVRQEWIDKKKIYKQMFQERYGINIPGTSNLYVYFVVKVIKDLKPGGNFVCIIYDSWQSTLYGRWLVEYINNECESIDVEMVDDQPFDDRLINATIISGKKKSANSERKVNILELLDKSLSPLSKIQGFVPIGSGYHTRRGLRLKQASFFLCDYQEFEDISTPFIKKIGKIKGYKVPSNHPEAALLVTEDTIDKRIMKELNHRLEIAKLNPDKNKPILNWFEERHESWFLHSSPPSADIIFNYYLRNRPRHLYLSGRSFSDNFYGLTVPEGLSVLACLAILNSTVVSNGILSNARNQGSGLHKIQLFEYRNVLVPDLRQLSEKERESFHELGLKLINNVDDSSDIIKEIDWLIYTVFSSELIKPVE